ncbi:MAG TPA: Omp28-related outer membrane protein [Saprospiraceae bacterium]|nr:Omp28-related outer membrane protein [Saprospiraceae bacterium]HRK82665.1 Omp28-related outer membrane protein [Saprospiraceae bacterium]
MKQLLPALLLLLLPALTNAQAVRRVMVESFTQASCGPCASQNPAFNALLQSNGDKVVLLKYQTNWPGYDPMNEQNPSEVAARVTYYQTTSVPNVRLDGVQNAGVASAVTQAMINNRLNQSTPIDMTLDHQISAGFDSIFIQCKIKNLGATEFNPGGVVLHTAVTEKQILFPTAPGSNGEVDFKSVMRKMLPNASGAALAAIPAGDSVTITYAAALPSYIYNFARIGVVAFVQKTSDRQVYQAVESFPKPLQGNIVDVAVYPNSIGPDGFCNYALTPQVDVANEGDTPITSMDVSYTLNGAAAVTQEWEGTLAPGGTVTITFPEIAITPGAAEVDYDVSNANGDHFEYNSLNELLSSEIYYTLSNEPVGTQITEGMESTPVRAVPTGTLAIKDAEDHFMVVNKGVLSSSVTQEVGGYGASTKSIFSNCYGWNDPGAEAHLIFEKIDLSGSTNNYVKFDYAHARYQTTSERMLVSISTDCGDTWTTIWNKAGAQLATAAATNNFYIPAVTHWRTDSVALTNFDGNGEVLVRFTVVTAYGNNIYLDNIRVYQPATSAADEPGLLAGKVQVYPNPASDLARIDVQLASASAVNISVFDLSGKLVHTIANGNLLSAGNHQFNWAPQAQGVFLVRVATDFGAVTEKVTVVK